MTRAKPKKRGDPNIATVYAEGLALGLDMGRKGECEACAKVADGMADRSPDLLLQKAYEGIAGLIRAREAMSQPPPKRNNFPAVVDLVIRDLCARDQKGQETYGVRLQPFNGRDAEQDEWEEDLDRLIYRRQGMEERRMLRPFEDRLRACALIQAETPGHESMLMLVKSARAYREAVLHLQQPISRAESHPDEHASNCRCDDCGGRGW